MTQTNCQKPPARVLIVDDHPAVREALAIRISMVSDLEVCGEASDVSDALALVAEQNPDLVIIDISLKTGDGLDLIKRIKASDASARLLVWSMHSETLYAGRALRAGAHGYVTKEQGTDQIVQIIRQVLDGKVYLSPAMTETLLHRAVGEVAAKLDRSPTDTLSDRELEVLRLIGQGVKTAEIANQLHLSVKTVETYRDRIRKKLHLADATDLVHYASQWVMVNP